MNDGEQSTFGDFATTDTEKAAKNIQGYRRAEIACDIEPLLSLSRSCTREHIVERCEYNEEQVQAAIWWLKSMNRVKEVNGGDIKGVLRRHDRYDDE